MDRYDILADGTRRDDRSPRLDYSEVKSLEDRYNIAYVRPLAGFGRKVIDVLVNRFFVIREEEDISCRSDYEYEVRMFISDRYGKDTVDKIFPKRHLHSLVVDKNWSEKYDEEDKGCEDKTS
jgi:predicted subunit of tRNA(5-methylaminomethyl-2-thiouridylate) methyltransferase